ncbi:hypothetical protein EGJ27_02820 [Pseudomonas sp. v388]|nr:hypothetical protein EGJ27_02820 [Pseudomonas sp. v388]
MSLRSSSQLAKQSHSTPNRRWLPDEEWQHALDQLRSLDEPHAASLSFKTCSELLQAMMENDCITVDQHSGMKTELHSLWTSMVNRLDQSKVLPTGMNGGS